MLLKAGTNVNAVVSGKTILQKAAKIGNAAVVRTLLEHGARIDLGSPDNTAIQMAAEKGNRDVVQILLDAGADINARDSRGCTCLFRGISHPGIVQLLVKRHANINLRALDGTTPFHCAIGGQHAQSAILLLNAGAKIESEDYEGRKPLDILLLDPKPSFHLVKLLLKHGCDIGRREMSSWHTILSAGDPDVIIITETSVNRPVSLAPGGSGSEAICSDGKDPDGTIDYGKPCIQLDIVGNPQEPPCFNVPSSFGSPVIRRLCSAPETKFLFPALVAGGISMPRPPRQGTLPATGSAIEWQWFLLDGGLVPSGHGLSSIGRLVIAMDKQALLSCYVCFQWFDFPDTGGKSPSDPHLSKAFHVELQKSEISWVMRKPCADPNAQSDPGKPAKSNPIFRTEDFRSTLDIGWIPDSGLDFFTLFVLDSHRKWRKLLEKADAHLATNRKILLRNKGRTNDFIDNLLLDAQQWSNFRALLQTHVRKAMDLVQDFKEKRYLCDEVGLGSIEKNLGKRKKSASEVAINKLSTIIRRMESEVEFEIRKLDEKTQEMIELEFNLVSIYEARTSKEMGMSMKRLSWITFVFLPLMFVTSFFGMNIDLINGGPHWTWVLKLSGSVFGLVILVWILLKLIPVDKWLEEHRGAPNIEKWREASRNLGRGLRKAARRRRHGDLESGKVVTDEKFEFKPPPRQWTKLKDL